MVINMEKLQQLIRYAAQQGDLEELQAQEGEIGRYAVSGRVFRLTAQSDGFLDEDGLWRFLKRRYPIIEVIELIRAAVECGVIIDVSNGCRLADLGCDYSAICASSEIFVFCTRTEEKTYKLVFSHQLQDADNGIEYAHRSSKFVDALVKSVVNKYGVLYAESFCSSESVINTSLPLHKSVITLGGMRIDDGGRTADPMAQVKVLIRYRDTVGNSTFIENIIDDIFVYCPANGATEWSFPKLRFDERGGSDSGFKRLTAEDRKKVYRLRRTVESAEGKRAMFSELKNHEGSALYEVIEKRKAEYAKAVKSGITPVVEYSITPLAVYCSYPTQKTVTYRLRSNPGFREKGNAKYDHEVRYSISVFDSEIDRFWIEREDGKHVISEENPLVLAYTRNFTREEGIAPIPACMDCVSVLSDLNPTFYGGEEFRGVFFLTSELCTRNSFKQGTIGYDTDEHFLISDLKKCELDGKYYHVKDLREVDVALVNGELRDDGRKKYVHNQPDVVIHTCDFCGTVYGGSLIDIKKYKNMHEVVNRSGKCCCDKCVGARLSSGGMILRVRGRDGGTVYVQDDVRKLSSVCICNCSDELTYKAEAVRCGCCGEYVNADYILKEGGLKLCSVCRGESDVISQGKDASSPAVEDVWRGVRSAMKPSDILNKDRCVIFEKGGGSEPTGYVWVYVDTPRKKEGARTNVYCFVKDTVGKRTFYYLKNRVSLKRKGSSGRRG